MRSSFSRFLAVARHAASSAAATTQSNSKPITGAIYAASQAVWASAAAAPSEAWLRSSIGVPTTRGFASSNGSGDDAYYDFEDRIVYPTPRAFVGEPAPEFVAPGEGVHF